MSTSTPVHIKIDDPKTLERVKAIYASMKKEENNAMKQKIKQYVEKHQCIYVDIENASYKPIFDFYFNEIRQETGTSIEMYYYGLYYHIHDDMPKMIHYYQLAIDKGSTSAMIGMGVYYEHVNDIDKAIEHYQLAIDEGNSYGNMYMAKLYLRRSETTQMTKFFKAAVAEKNSHGIYIYGLYFKAKILSTPGIADKAEFLRKMIPLFEQSAELGNTRAMLELGKHYESSNDNDKALLYYLMVTEHGNDDGLYHLGMYYKKNNLPNLMIKCFNECIKKGYDSVIFELAEYYKQKNEHEHMIGYYIMGHEKGINRCTSSINEYVKNSNDTFDLVRYRKYLDTDNKKRLMKFVMNQYKIIDWLNSEKTSLDGVMKDLYTNMNTVVAQPQAIGIGKKKMTLFDLIVEDPNLKPIGGCRNKNCQICYSKRGKWRF